MAVKHIIVGLPGIGKLFNNLDSLIISACHSCIKLESGISIDLICLLLSFRLQVLLIFLRYGCQYFCKRKT